MHSSTFINRHHVFYQQTDILIFIIRHNSFHFIRANLLNRIHTRDMMQMKIGLVHVSQAKEHDFTHIQRSDTPPPLQMHKCCPPHKKKNPHKICLSLFFLSFFLFLLVAMAMQIIHHFKTNVKSHVKELS